MTFASRALRLAPIAALLAGFRHGTRHVEQHRTVELALRLHLDIQRR